MAKDISDERPEGYIYIIPVRFDSCEVPYSIKDLLWVDIFGNTKDEQYSKLIRSLNLVVKQRGLDELIEAQSIVETINVSTQGNIILETKSQPAQDSKKQNIKGLRKPIDNETKAKRNLKAKKL